VPGVCGLQGDGSSTALGVSTSVLPESTTVGNTEATITESTTTEGTTEFKPSGETTTELPVSDTTVTTETTEATSEGTTEFQPSGSTNTEFAPSDNTDEPTDSTTPEPTEFTTEFEPSGGTDEPTEFTTEFEPSGGTDPTENTPPNGEDCDPDNICNDQPGFHETGVCEIEYWHCNLVGTGLYCPVEERCTDGTVFDPAIGNCNFPFNVPQCEFVSLQKIE